MTSSDSNLAKSVGSGLRLVPRAERDYRVILTGVDASAHSLMAFEYFLDNIFRTSDHVICLSVIEPQDVMGPTAMGAVPANLAHLYKHALDEKKQEVEKVMRNFKKEAEKREVKSMSYRILVSSDVGHAICEYCKSHEIDLVVLGTRGIGTIRRTILGSVSNHVLHHAHVPTMIKPPTADSKHSHHTHHTHRKRYESS